MRGRSAKSDLKLWFVNSMVKKTLELSAKGKSLSPASLSADWSSRGKWRGALRSGWAGGAEVIPYHDPSTAYGIGNNGGRASANPNPTFESNRIEALHRREFPSDRGPVQARPPPPHPPPAAARAVNNKTQQEELTLSLVTQTRNPSHRGFQPDFAILKALPKALRQPPTRPRKVRFQAGNDERIFDKETASLHWLVYGPASSAKGGYKLASPAAGSTRDRVSREEAEAASLKAIAKSVRSNDLDGFLKELKGGHIRTDSCIEDENWLSREYKFAKERKMYDIKTALNIHRTARTVIAFAQSLRCWTRYEIKVEQISGMVRQTGSLRTDSFEGIVEYRIMGKTEPLEPLPVRNVSASGVVKYREDNVPVYDTIHYNSGVPEDRSLVVELRSTVDRSLFASVVIPISLVCQKCQYLGKPVVFERECRIGEAFEAGVKIQISAKKVVLEKHYLGEFSMCA